MRWPITSGWKGVTEVDIQFLSPRAIFTLNRFAVSKRTRPHLPNVFLRPTASKICSLMRSTLWTVHWHCCIPVFSYWHCQHSMRSRVYVAVGSPSVRLSVPSFDGRCGWAPRGQDISIDSGGRRRPAATAPQHGAQQQMRAVSCWQPSWRGSTYTRSFTNALAQFGKQLIRRNYSQNNVLYLLVFLYFSKLALKC